MASATRIRGDIVERDGKWCVLSKKTRRNFGCYDSKAEAQKRLRQIEKFSTGQLRQLSEELGWYVRASEGGENFAPGYEDDPGSFARLRRLERRMEADLKGYFRALGERSPARVDWQSYALELAKKAADPVDPAAGFAGEMELLRRALYEAIFLSAMNGAAAGSAIYGIPIEEATLVAVVGRAARKHTAGLVKSVTATTRDVIRNSVSTSLQLGETVAEAQKRLRTVVDNPNRARAIARTESVNGYGSGLQAFGEETGAKRKEWQAVIDGRTSSICLALHRQVRRIDENFRAVVGSMVVSVPRPAAHPNCRSTMILIYD